MFANNLISIKNIAMTTSGQCKNCHRIINHFCIHGEKIISASRKGIIVRLRQKSDGAFECQFCPNSIQHHCK